MSEARALSAPEIRPTDEQARAIAAICEWYMGGRSTPQEFYLAGYAGVGKSTIARIAIEELQARARVRTVRTATFTGKAANVLRRKGVDAQTIHSLIYRPVPGPDGTVRFRLDIAGPAADADLIVLDEVSMVSEELARDLRSFGKKMLVMGDPGQLPPVKGQGAFTAREPDAFLAEIHRQAADSPILRLATMARQGRDIPAGDYGDGVRVLPLTLETQPLVYRDDTQVLCGLHRVRWAYTQRIRRRRGFEGPAPQPGEALLCCRNSKELGIFNGGFGTLLGEARDAGDGLLGMDLAMEDLDAPLRDVDVHPYLFAQHFAGTAITRPQRMPKDVLEFDWGYLLTVHKAQGSEFPHVTVVDDSASFREDRAKWLYTALTRASEGLTLLKREG